MLVDFLQIEYFHEFVGDELQFVVCGQFRHPIGTYNYLYNMDFSYQGYSAYMNSLYLHVYNWPNPYHYNEWYQTVPVQQHDMALHPDYYTQIYTYAMQEFTNKTNKTKVVLSRNQKRKQKKRELQQELERETKAIGSWVKLQRKDLINDLQRIKKKEEKMQQKKEKKLGHLIEIHKEIFKHHNKKSSSQHPIKRRVNTTSSKKRISQIKKMKQAFQSDKNKIFTLSHKQHAETSKQVQEKVMKQEDWESDDEEQKMKIEQKQQPQQQKQQSKEGTTPKKEVVIEPITYTSIGKLTGKMHNNICLREWVRNCPSQQLDDLVLRLVNRLAYKQAIRKVQKQDKAKKIIVSGLKQCKRTLTTIIQKKKARLLIVALNIQRNPYKGGVDDQVQSIIEIAQKQKIPIINASTRANLGRAFTGKWGPRVTMVSVINYQGYQDMVEELRKEWQGCCKMYDLI